MTLLSFIAEITKALAWPLACIIIARLFRQELRKLLSRMIKGKVGLAEFEFEREVRELGNELAPELSTQETKLDSFNRHYELATVEPRSAIISAWLGVEKAAFELAKSHNNYSMAQSRNPFHIIRDLEKNKLLPPTLVKLFQELRTLRNQAVHEADFNPSLESTLNYIELSQFLAAYLENLDRAS